MSTARLLLVCCACMVGARPVHATDNERLTALAALFHQEGPVAFSLPARLAGKSRIAPAKRAVADAVMQETETEEIPQLADLLMKEAGEKFQFQPGAWPETKPGDSMRYVIAEASGKQYWLEKDRFYDFDKMPLEPGDTFKLNRVLLARGEASLSIGRPYVDKVSVKLKVLRHIRGKKIRVFKYKPKKGYRRTIGHRDYLTRVLVEDIEVTSPDPVVGMDGKTWDQVRAAKDAARKAKEDAEAANRAEDEAGELEDITTVTTIRDGKVVTEEFAR